MLDRINPRLLWAAIGVLAVLILAGQYSRRKTLHGNFDATPTRTIDTAGVTRVVIWPQYVMTDRTNCLIRKDSVWTLLHGDAEYPASQQAVRDMLAALRSIRTSRIVSHSEADWNQYGLEAQVGTRVCVYADTTLLIDFRLGRLSMFDREGGDSATVATYGFDPNYIDTYMRIEGDPTVFMADGFFSHNFSRLWEDWVDSVKLLQLMADPLYSPTANVQPSLSY